MDAHGALVAANPHSPQQQDRARATVRRAAASRGPSPLLGGVLSEVVIVLLGLYAMVSLGAILLLPDTPLWGRATIVVLEVILARFVVFRWPYRAFVHRQRLDAAVEARKKIGCRTRDCAYDCYQGL